MSSVETSRFHEQHVGIYNFLPPATAALLERWEYQGTQASTKEVGPVMPTVAFNTVDLKLPAEGSAQILEINGTNSGLYGYRAGLGDLLVRSHIATMCESLGLPRARFRYIDTRISQTTHEPYYEEIADGFHPYSDLIDLPVGVGRVHDVTARLHEHANHLTVSEAHIVARSLLDARTRQGRKPPTRWQARNGTIDELSQAAALVELSSMLKINPTVPDNPALVTVNPVEIRLLESDKARFASYCQQIDLDHYRPRTSLLFADAPDYAPKNDIREIPDIERFVLKLAHEAGGNGVICLSRAEMEMLSQQARDEGSWRRAVLPWTHKEKCSDPQKQKMADALYFSAAQKMTLEEYVPSKTIEGSIGYRYDATMRIAVLSFANRGHISVMPLAAYWKLPLPHNRDSQGVATGCSDIMNAGSLPVSDEDFQRAFHGTADLMTQLLARCRSADPDTYLWPSVEAD